MDQLEATLQACLRQADAGGDARSSLHDALPKWLDEADPAARCDLLVSLSDALQRACPESAACFSEPALASAFARSLLKQAQQEVATEAARAGHANSYDTLSNWIEQKADSAILHSLGQAMGRSPADLRTALGRLRSRFLQRVESGLGDWCSSPGTRQTLRRRLRDALLTSETSA